MHIDEPASATSSFATATTVEGWNEEIIGRLRRRRLRGTIRALRHDWSVRPGRCRSLVAQLRRTAAVTEQPSVFDRATVPVLLDRVGAACPELLDLASALERATRPNPESVAIIDYLLHDGVSPIYDRRAPEAELTAALKQARAGLSS